jgi:hypothetical protein
MQRLLQTTGAERNSKVGIYAKTVEYKKSAFDVGSRPLSSFWTSAEFV